MTATRELSELVWAGAAEQARLVSHREVGARELVEATLARIARLDPELNAFRVVRGERALEEAGDACAGPLTGVPVAVKDDTDVAGERTCYGTAAHGRRAARDAPVVAALRRAGAVIVGKTNVPEVDAWAFTETMTYGATRNPWDTSRSAGGSSGGSGVAAAAGMCGVAHGTDGTGSLRNPPAWLGVIGFKPGRDLLPGPAALTGWNGMVVDGAIARRTADVAAFLEATAGPGYAEAAATPPKRMRIALTMKPPPGMGGKLEDHRWRAVEEAAAMLRSLGHEVRDRDPDLPQLTGLAISARYYGGVADDVDELDDPELLESRTRSLARLGRTLRPLLPLAARVERAAAAALDEVHRDCDLLLFPGSTQPPEPIGRFRDRGALFTAYVDTAQVAFQPLWNLVGRPAVMVPWDLDGDGLPTAIQLGGPPGSERRLLSLVAQLEHERQWPARRPPLDI